MPTLFKTIGLSIVFLGSFIPTCLVSSNAFAQLGYIDLQIFPLIGEQRGSWLGYEVAYGGVSDVSHTLKGAIAVVGEPLRRGPNNEKWYGDVRIYFKNVNVTNSTWTLIHGLGNSIRPLDLNTDARFGISVAIDMDGTIVVGAPGVDGAVTHEGAAYIYKFNGDFAVPLWSLDEVLKAEPEERKIYGGFGTSVDICPERGSSIVVGSPGATGEVHVSGAVYYFPRDFATGEYITPIEIAELGSNPYDRFGYSVAIERDADTGQDIILAGAPSADFAGDKSGAAYIYAFPLDSFDLPVAPPTRQKLLNFEAEADDQFGYSVDLATGKTDFMSLATFAAIGSPYDDEEFVDGGSFTSLVVDTSATPDPGWQVLPKAVPSDDVLMPNDNDRFGWSVCIGKAIVEGGFPIGFNLRTYAGGPLYDGRGINSGTVVAYDGLYDYRGEIYPAENDPYDLLGYSLSYLSENLMVGAPAKQKPDPVGGGSVAGDAYLFELPGID